MTSISNNGVILLINHGWFQDDTRGSGTTRTTSQDDMFQDDMFWEWNQANYKFTNHRSQTCCPGHPGIDLLSWSTRTCPGTEIKPVNRILTNQRRCCPGMCRSGTQYLTSWVILIEHIFRCAKNEYDLY